VAIKNRKKREPDPNGVIASRVIQDIIDGATDEFRTYLQSRGGAQPFAAPPVNPNTGEVSPSAPTPTPVPAPAPEGGAGMPWGDRAYINGNPIPFPSVSVGGGVPLAPGAIPPWPIDPSLVGMGPGPVGSGGNTMPQLIPTRRAPWENPRMPAPQGLGLMASNLARFAADDPSSFLPPPLPTQQMGAPNPVAEAAILRALGLI